jgi:hypothetical protein
MEPTLALAKSGVNMDRNWYDPIPTMRKRGRKSAASFSVAPVVDVRMQLLEPPSRLSAAEKRVWRETAETVKPGWFRGSESVLEMYCRSVVLERRLAGWLKQIDDPTDARYRDLVSMHKVEAMLVANLATKLRLTVRSTKDRYAPKSVSSAGPKPWVTRTHRDDPDDEPPPGA